MVEFKTIRYRHWREAMEFVTAEEAGEDRTDEYMGFVIGMVKTWDFTDPDTEEKIPVSADALYDMTVEQIKEMAGSFNRRFAQMSTVPKVSASKSSSILTPKQRAEIVDNSPTG